MFIKLFFGINGFFSTIGTALSAALFGFLFVASYNGGLWPVILLLAGMVAIRAVIAFSVAKSWERAGFEPTRRAGWDVAIDGNGRVAMGARVFRSDEVAGTVWQSRGFDHLFAFFGSRLTVTFRDGSTRYLQFYGDTTAALEWGQLIRAA